MPLGTEPGRYADRHRLGIAEPEGGGVAPGARVVVVETEDLVEEQEAAQVSGAGSSGMRPRTVHKHLDQIFDKLGVENPHRRGGACPGVGGRPARGRSHRLSPAVRL
jgi:hypothetical protein